MGRIGRTESYKNIEELTASEVTTLRALYNWDYTKTKSTAFAISLTTRHSLSSVSKNLRYLKTRGLVKLSLGGAWILNPDIKKMWQEDDKKTEETEPKDEPQESQE